MGFPQHSDLTWSHGFEHHLYIIDSQIHISSPQLVPAFPASYLRPSSHLCSHAQPSLRTYHVLNELCSATLVLPFLCKWTFNNQLPRPKTLEASLTPLLLYPSNAVHQQITLALISNYIQNPVISRGLHHGPA